MSAHTVQKKMALQMLILQKSGKNTERDINVMILSLPKPLKNLVKQEFDRMSNMSLEDLEIEFSKFFQQ